MQVCSSMSTANIGGVKQFYYAIFVVTISRYYSRTGQWWLIVYYHVVRHTTCNARRSPGCSQASTVTYSTRPKPRPVHCPCWSLSRCAMRSIGKTNTACLVHDVIVTSRAPGWCLHVATAGASFNCFCVIGLRMRLLVRRQLVSQAHKNWTTVSVGIRDAVKKYITFPIRCQKQLTNIASNNRTTHIIVLELDFNLPHLTDLRQHGNLLRYSSGWGFSFITLQDTRYVSLEDVQVCISTCFLMMIIIYKSLQLYNIKFKKFFITRTIFTFFQ